jgi:hypothetical protein
MTLDPIPGGTRLNNEMYFEAEDVDTVKAHLDEVFVDMADSGPAPRKARFLSQALCTVRSMEQRTVAGENIEVLRAALAKMTHREASDGMVEISLRLEPGLGEPLQRALLRIEKELLDHDVAHGNPDLRTTPQRMADAFVVLTERVTAALDGP